jgi:ABC-type Fe3+ transport system permease subunit
VSKEPEDNMNLWDALGISAQQGLWAAGGALLLALALAAGLARRRARREVGGGFQLGD